MSQKKLSAFFSRTIRDNNETDINATLEGEMDSTNSVKKAKFDPKYEVSRAIKAEWFTLFPWLEIDKNEHVFRCSFCVKAKKHNVFVSGKSSSKPKKDDFIKHERGEDHKLAKRIPEQRQEMRTAITSAKSHARDAIIGTMKTVLCLAQADIPNCNVSTIVELQVDNVSIISVFYLYFIKNV